MNPVKAYIGLGSNLDDPLSQVRSAVEEIGELPETRVTAVSPWYRSDPLGPGPQPDYINGVVAIETGIEPHALLARLQEIELRHGRTRTERWGPRTLDLDILLFGDQRIASPELEIPHPEMHRRPFVLLPLAEIDPRLVLPDGTSIGGLLANCPAEGIVRLTGATDRTS